MSLSQQTQHEHDLSLVRRSQAGDTAAFEQLVLKYQDAVFNATHKMLGNRDDAAETAQEIFLNLFRSIRSFREEAQFSTYLWRTVINCVTSARRKRVVRRGMKVVPFGPAQGEDAEMDPPDPGAVEPDGSMTAYETRNAVTAAIAELEEEFRAVVVLKDIEGLDYDGISNILKVPVGTVKSRLHRARCQLREKLADFVE